MKRWIQLTKFDMGSQDTTSLVAANGMINGDMIIKDTMMIVL
jgi:hypothetical protein